MSSEVRTIKTGDSASGRDTTVYAAKPTITHIQSGDIFRAEYFNRIAQILYNLYEILRLLPTLRILSERGSLTDSVSRFMDITVIVENQITYNTYLGFTIKLFSENTIYRCDEFYQVTSPYNPPPGICEELYQGWDYVFFIEDLPLDRADKDFEDLVLRLRIELPYFYVNVLEGGHYHPLTVSWKDIILVKLPSRTAQRYDFVDRGTWRINTETDEVVKVA